MNAHLIAVASSPLLHSLSPQASTSIYGGALYVMLAIAAFNLAVVYNMWRVLEPSNQARCSASAATGLLLIPGINVIWVFVAFVGWAHDYNAIVQSNDLDIPLVPARTMWAYVIATLIPVPVVSQLIQARCLLVIWRAMRRMSRIDARSFR